MSTNVNQLNLLAEKELNNANTVTALEQLVYTVPQLSEVLQIGKNAAYALTHSKGFPVFEIGKKKLIPRAGLEQWLNTQTTK